ncbi:MAG: 50S ribosomal protein L15 [Candidatus Omnitrophica bacterium]|nr:50S ribosomal protein L15 [Candidatus Omnitrophota bacterium]
MDLSKLTSKLTKTPKRMGRGTGSGWGKTAGRGNKGAGSRSGKKLPYIGFNGGNIPLIRKLPKRGFNVYKPTEYQIVNLQDIQEHLTGISEIGPKALKEAKLIRSEDKPLKVLATLKGTFSLKARFMADKFSQSAKKAIEGAGGAIEYLKR